MEFLALLALVLASAIGWIFCVGCLSRQIAPEERIYFAPAIGLLVCGVVGYVAVQLRISFLVTAFSVATLLGGAYLTWSRWTELAATPVADRLARFSIVVVLALFTAQLVVLALFSRVYPGPDQIWSLFNLSGVPPPDQMFAWHQAMFLDQHRVYPRDIFYNDMDLYDRPHLGGWITLFFFKLFRLPLTEYNGVYPSAALRFYHCFWWLLNNLYLVGVAALFRRLFGQRAAVFAVASTAVGGFFFLCSVGAWMKFSSAYPFLLSILLFLNGKAPVLQALLCAASYYIHGSVLPYLAGFGILQIMSLRYPVGPRRVALRHLLLFSSIGVVVVGAWFVVVRLMDSKQPLLYYYLYGAALTAAQTRPVEELAREFYGRYSWGSVSLLPLRNLADSIFPVWFYIFFKSGILPTTASRFFDFASAVFFSQRFWLTAALGVVAVPVVIAGWLRALALEHAGKIAFCFYLVPTLFIALLYRNEWPFSVHVIVLYHTSALFMWVAVLRRFPRWSAAVLAAIAAEGVLCVFFAEMRFMPVRGLQLTTLTSVHWGWIAAYLALLAFIIAYTSRELRRAPSEGDADDGVVPSLPPMTLRTLLVSSSKIAAALGILAAVVAVYALYSRRFY